MAADVRAATDGDVVLVGHSVAGTLLPRIASQLGTVRHLVFVAGITAPEGQVPWDAFLDGQHELASALLAKWRRVHSGKCLEAIGDARDRANVDSLNFSSQPMTWANVDVPRTFIRCLRDPIQDRALQDRFIEFAEAGDVLEIDSGHTAALDAPLVLAALLDGVLDAPEGGTAGVTSPR